MIALSTAVSLFHILVLIGIIPFSLVWAGKINSVTEMRTFEAVLIIINSFLIFIPLLRSNYIKNKIQGEDLM